MLSRRPSNFIPTSKTVIMTGKPTEKSAIAAIKYGVFDYLGKPTRLADIAVMFGRISQRIADRKLLAALHQRIRHHEGDSELVGSGDAMNAVKNLDLESRAHRSDRSDSR